MHSQTKRPDPLSDCFMPKEGVADILWTEGWIFLGERRRINLCLVQKQNLVRPTSLNCRRTLRTLPQSPRCDFLGHIPAKQQAVSSNRSKLEEGLVRSATCRWNSGLRVAVGPVVKENVSVCRCSHGIFILALRLHRRSDHDARRRADQVNVLQEMSVSSSAPRLQVSVVLETLW